MNEGRAMIRNLALLVFCLSAESASAWQVIGQEPGAVPVQQAIGDLLDRYSEQEGAVEELQAQAVSAPDALPLTSRLAPRRGLRSIRISQMLTAPVCVIGSDAISRAWIETNRARLHDLGARCVLAEAGSERDIRIMTRLAHPVPVAALPFDDLAELHGIDAYPVLIIGSGS